MIRVPETISFWRGDLPHWEIRNGLYFVTIHLAGAVPAAALTEIRRKLATVQGNTDYEAAYRQAFQAIEHYLETAPVVTDLADPAAADIIVDAIATRQTAKKWDMIAYVIMPNHIHLFFRTENRLKPLLENFKTWTGREIRRIQDRHGQFWQAEWFDHWSRSPQQDERIIRYIRNNPVKAGLVERWQDWPWLKVRNDKP